MNVVYQSSRRFRNSRRLSYELREVKIDFISLEKEQSFIRSILKSPTITTGSFFDIINSKSECNGSSQSESFVDGGLYIHKSMKGVPSAGVIRRAQCSIDAAVSIIEARNVDLV